MTLSTVDLIFFKNFYSVWVGLMAWYQIQAFATHDWLSTHPGREGCSLLDDCVSSVTSNPCCPFWVLTVMCSCVCRSYAWSGSIRLLSFVDRGVNKAADSQHHVCLRKLSVCPWPHYSTEEIAAMSVTGEYDWVFKFRRKKHTRTYMKWEFSSQI